MQHASDTTSIAARLAPRLPFFYGWIIIYISFFSIFMMGAMTFWAIPLFVGPMHQDTGWSHAAIFGGLAVRGVVGGFGGMVLGPLADRRGWPQRLLLAGLLIDGVALVALRWVDSPLQFLLLYGIAGGAGSTGSRLVQSTLVAKWFVARRGMAVGFSANGASVAALVMGPATAFLISELGWRDAWTALAVLMFVVMLPCVPFAVRSPEDIGLLPDNGVTVSRPGARRSAATERSYRLSDLIHTYQFWLVLGGMLIGSYSLQTQSIIMVPHFEEIGFSASTAASSLAVYGIFSTGMRFLWGMLGDRLSVRRAIVIQSALTAVGVVLLLQIAGSTSLYLAMAYQGVFMSGFPPLSILLWPEFYGRMHIGSIVGITQFFSTLAGSAGPVLAGVVHDQTGSYEPALWFLVVSWATCAAIMFLIRPASEQARDAPAPTG